MDEPSDIQPGEPYCNNCGYVLIGLEDSSKCPECGRPLVEVLVRGKMQLGRGRRYTSDARLFGLPVISVAMGPSGQERYGKAKGIIAIGDTAVGFLAVGGRAFGIVAVGGFAVGGASVGGGSIGAITALGGAALGSFAVGGAAVGGIAVGGGAAGFVAKGGGAAGYYAAGAGTWGRHTIDLRGASSPQAQATFHDLSWLIGPVGPAASLLQPLAVSAGAFTILALAIGLLALWAHRRHETRNPRSAS